MGSRGQVLEVLEKSSTRVRRFGSWLDPEGAPLHPVGGADPRSVGDGEGVAGQAVLNVLVELGRELRMARFPGRGAGAGRGPRPRHGGRPEDPPQVLAQPRPVLGADQSQQVPTEMDLAALPTRALEVPVDGGLEALVVVAG